MGYIKKGGNIEKGEGLRGGTVGEGVLKSGWRTYVV